MKKVVKQIPNLITSANLLCGCLASVFAGLNQFEAAFWTVLLGITFDLFDGMIARSLNITSDLGLQLDSLADVITSGFTPGIVVYQLFIRSGILVHDFKINIFSETIVFSIAPLALIAFFLPIGAAFRLAKFNSLQSKSSDFFGLPTPANALFFCSLPLMIAHPSFSFVAPLFKSAHVLIFLIFLSVFMMNSNWRLFSLKINSKSGINIFIFPLILFLISLLLVYIYQGAGFPIIILIYLMLSATRNWILFQA
ncbi:MAG: CDP-alcohol phosphatidyltransferase family protein [Flavobacteriaceae bacterium]|nr:CDP-alcohol phosphatidyltransferase family protein [Flavobacteriaceae bacterium]